MSIYRHLAFPEFPIETESCNCQQKTEELSLYNSFLKFMQFYSDPAVMLSELEKTNCSDILELMSLEDLYSVMNTSTKGTTVPAKNRSGKSLQ
ncbi:hypothetical protein RRG08_051244 [Elysia crispata]|uniref:Uncharacterized protein n=1 Tax=Elysia crispata TaxID=231223 RepID=A0AAE1DL21_9GAST|nr:hypothetical protein RRG08_051244 [Elysia crispata]